MGLDMYLVRKKKRTKLCYENTETIAYWRKANSIHGYIVSKVVPKDIRDEYNGDYVYLSEKRLNLLLKKVNYLLDNIKLADGHITNGFHMDKETGKFLPNIEEGKVILNPKLCERVLPTTDGFFFGNQEYNEFYYNDLVHTKEVLEKVLAETDFSTHKIYYCACW